MRAILWVICAVQCVNVQYMLSDAQKMYYIYKMYCGCVECAICSVLKI